MRWLLRVVSEVLIVSFPFSILVTGASQFGRSENQRKPAPALVPFADEHCATGPEDARYYVRCRTDPALGAD
jgi:hypothetical protein